MSACRSPVPPSELISHHVCESWLCTKQGAGGLGQGEVSRGGDIQTDLWKVLITCQMDGEDAPVEGAVYRSQRLVAWIERGEWQRDITVPH